MQSEPLIFKAFLFPRFHNRTDPFALLNEYGRRTSQFKILPFDFFESRKYFRNFSDMDKAIVYGIVGGTPQYLLQMDDSIYLVHNIKDKLLNSTSYLRSQTTYCNRKRKVVGDFKYGGFIMITNNAMQLKTN